MSLKIKKMEMIKNLRQRLTFRAKEIDSFKQNSFINILKYVTSGDLKGFFSRKLWNPQDMRKIVSCVHRVKV